MPLTLKQIERLKVPGRYLDGRNLYLVIRESGARSWLFWYTSPVTGRRREMGLGPTADVSLDEARELAAACRKQVRAGVDPIETRWAEQDARRAAARAALEARGNTYEAVARAYLAAQPAGAYPRDREGWLAAQVKFVFPVLGSVPVTEADGRSCVAAFTRTHPDPRGKALWYAAPDVARGLRYAMERVFGWATFQGLRAGPNPAAWAGNLQYVWPRLPKNGGDEKHHPALPWNQTPEFMAQLRGRRGISARALEFAILTAARAGEVLGARWTEVNLTTAVWTVPAVRMKARRKHEVPLSARALAILARIPRQLSNPYIFIGRVGERLHDSALEAVIYRMNDARRAAGLPRWVDPAQGRRAVVPHGLRSTFRDWVGEATDFDRDLAEAALAHVKGDKTEAAYARGTRLEKRRAMMEAWSQFCSGNA